MAFRSGRGDRTTDLDHAASDVAPNGAVPAFRTPAG